MATPEELNSSMIAALSAAKLGPAPGGDPAAGGMPPQGQPPGAPPAGAAPQNPAPRADPTPTDMEKAQAKVAPNSESQMSDADAIQFIKLGDREYTSAQLSGTLDRHAKLNYRWQTEVAPMSPVLDVVKKMMTQAKEAGHDIKPEELAKFVDSAVRAYAKDPQMGGNGKPQQSGDGAGNSPDKGGANLGDNDDETYSKWEKENAVSLPPGLKETVKSNREMNQKMDQLMSMLTNLAQGGANGDAATAQAKAEMEKARGIQGSVATDMIKNNLNSAFAALQMPLDDAAKGDFRLFAAQRGYDFPDFMDAEMARTIVADYKANKDAPEVVRLREIARKRQAFTGNVEGAPSGGGAGGGSPKAGADTMLSGLVDSAMSQRQLR